MKPDCTSTAVIYITNRSRKLSEKIKILFPEADLLRYNSAVIKQMWDTKRLLIFIMATGIVIRSISPLIKNKKTDPAVLVIDEQGRYVISLLSGHLGGANIFARQVANFLGAQPVITTASDINELTPIDVWAHDNNMIIENPEELPSISTKLLNQGYLKIYEERTMELPDEFLRVDEPEKADILITNKQNPYKGIDTTPLFRQLIIRPKNLVLGLGCNSGTTCEEIDSVVTTVLRDNNMSLDSISCIATIDIKAFEKGVVEYAERYRFNIKTFTADEINTVNGIEKSDAVFKATGAFAVAEPCSILASGHGNLVIKKQKRGNVTIAVAEINPDKTIQKGFNIKENLNKLNKKGKIFIVGTGPGDINHITPYAIKSIKSSDFIVGYDTYIQLIHEIIKGKNIVTTGMTEEIDRCKKAIELANEGKTVSVISGGDPGIYAMAGLVFELLIALMAESKNQFYMPDVEVIPGISALNAAASRLGAPLMHDFASISLSDRLTPWDVIAKRLDSAASSDFVIVIYNPKSKGRSEHINIAASIIQKYRTPDTPVGIVRKAMREGEKVIITTLKDFLNYEIDMQTTIIVGNSMTFISEGWMVTPRGYRVNVQRDK